MFIKKTPESTPASSEITSESDYLNRRELLKKTGLFGLGAAGLSSGGIIAPAHALPSAYKTAAESRKTPAWLRKKIRSRYVERRNPTGETMTPYASASTYNNFYEFGTSKADPAEYAGSLKTNPWTVAVDGLCEKPANYQLEDFIKPHYLEDRIYRFRCVEAWSMVVPWLGFSLSNIIKKARPYKKARFVKFTTLFDPKQMPEQKTGGGGIDWPYVEGLRMDEAMNPLATLAVGMYGRSLPNQNGAPLRLILPWKYGFKSIKSIVKITFMEKAPVTTWLGLAPQEYGFYANVNPNVSHPRWSQARERRLPNSLFNPNWVDTKMFNGYQREVASMYSRMDLKRFY